MRVHDLIFLNHLSRLSVSLKLSAEPSLSVLADKAITILTEGPGRGWAAVALAHQSWNGGRFLPPLHYRSSPRALDGSSAGARSHIDTRSILS